MKLKKMPHQQLGGTAARTFVRLATELEVLDPDALRDLVRKLRLAARKQRRKVSRAA